MKNQQNQKEEDLTKSNKVLSYIGESISADTMRAKIVRTLTQDLRFDVFEILSEEIEEVNIIELIKRKEKIQAIYEFLDENIIFDLVEEITNSIIYGEN